MSNDISKKYAFPITRKLTNGDGQVLAPGMTKREYFAGQIMQSLAPANRSTGESPENLAEKAVRYADALIAALEGQPAKTAPASQPSTEAYVRGYR